VDQLFFPSFMAKMESSTSEKALASGDRGLAVPVVLRVPGVGEGAARSAWCRWACLVARRPTNVAVCIAGVHDGLVGPQQRVWVLEHRRGRSGTVAARKRHGMGDY
jgi:hypothetical protein